MNEFVWGSSTVDGRGPEFYKLEDLAIGSVIQAYGRYEAQILYTLGWVDIVIGTKDKPRSVVYFEEAWKIFLETIDTLT
jgi:hypothetical protein